jgi:hypothetical protein
MRTPSQGPRDDAMQSPQGPHLRYPQQHQLSPDVTHLPPLSIHIETTLTLHASQAYTKGAIYRQMQEYSRKAATAESRLEELHKRSVHHDDHLRIIDAWWLQVQFSSPLASSRARWLTCLVAGRARIISWNRFIRFIYKWRCVSATPDSALRAKYC